MTDAAAILDRKLSDLCAEEADLLYRLEHPMAHAERKATAARLKVVRAESDRLSYEAFDAWDAEREDKEVP